MAYDNIPQEMKRDLLADKCQKWLWSEFLVLEPLEVASLNSLDWGH